MEIFLGVCAFIGMMVVFTIGGALGAMAFHYIGDGIIALMYPTKKDTKEVG